MFVASLNVQSDFMATIVNINATARIIHLVILIRVIAYVKEAGKEQTAINLVQMDFMARDAKKSVRILFMEIRRAIM